MKELLKDNQKLNNLTDSVLKILLSVTVYLLVIEFLCECGIIK